MLLLGICFSPRRAGNGSGVGRCRGVSGGERMKDEGRRMKGCRARQISGVNFALGKIHALLSLSASMRCRSALPTFFWQRIWIDRTQAAGCGGAARASIAIRDEDGTVFEGNFDLPSRCGTLVETSRHGPALHRPESTRGWAVRAARSKTVEAHASTRSFSTRRFSMMNSCRSGVFLPMKKERSSSLL